MLISRQSVRTIVDDSLRRLSAARHDGERMAVYNDLCDETADRLGHIQSVHGDAGVWQYAWMIEQTKREMEAGKLVHQIRGARSTPINWLGWATFAAFVAFGLISLMR